MLLGLEFGVNCGPQGAGKAASMRGLLTGSFRALEHGWRLEFQFLPTEQRVGCGVCSFYFPVQCFMSSESGGGVMIKHTA